VILYTDIIKPSYILIFKQNSRRKKHTKILYVEKKQKNKLLLVPLVLEELAKLRELFSESESLPLDFEENALANYYSRILGAIN
jgi:hypothetical protein